MPLEPTPFVAHRLTTGRLIGWVVAAAVVLGVLDMVRRGQLTTDATTACVLLALLPSVYVLALRPAVLEGPDALEVRNPLRTSVLPWTAVSDVDVTDVLRVRCGERYIRCFAVPRRRPAPSVLRSASTTGMILPAKEPDQGWQPQNGQPRAEALAARLRDLRDLHGRGYAGTSKASPARSIVTRWAPDAVGAVAGAVLLLVLALVLL